MSFRWWLLIHGIECFKKILTGLPDQLFLFLVLKLPRFVAHDALLIRSHQFCDIVLFRQYLSPQFQVVSILKLSQDELDLLQIQKIRCFLVTALVVELIEKVCLNVLRYWVDIPQYVEVVLAYLLLKLCPLLLHGLELLSGEQDELGQFLPLDLPMLHQIFPQMMRNLKSALLVSGERLHLLPHKIQGLVGQELMMLRELSLIFGVPLFVLRFLSFQRLIHLLLLYSDLVPFLLDRMDAPHFIHLCLSLLLDQLQLLRVQFWLRDRVQPLLQVLTAGKDDQGNAVQFIMVEFWLIAVPPLFPTAAAHARRQNNIKQDVVQTRVLR